MTGERCPFEDDVLALDDGSPDGPSDGPLDGASGHRLDATRRFVVEAHLAVCGSCAEFEETLDRAAAALRGAAVPPLGVAESALARIPSPPAVRPALKVAAAASFVAIVAAFVATWDRERIDIPHARPAPPNTAPPTSATDDTTTRPATEPGDDVATDVAPPDVPSVSPDGPSTAAYVPRSLEDLPRLVADIDPAGPDGDPRLVAAVRRTRSAGTAGAYAIAALLGGADRGVAQRALRVAGEVPSAQYAAPLGRLLGDEELGADAARQLGTIAAPAAVEQLALGLDGPSRAAVLEALATCRSPRAFDVLASRVRGGADPKPAQVLDAAVTASPALAARLLLELATSRDTVAVADVVLRDRRDSLVPALLPLAGKSDGLIAAAAVRALGATGDAAAVATLRTAGTRFALARPAAEALVAMGTPASFAAAFDVASDPRAPTGLLNVFDERMDAAAVLVRSLADARAGRRAAAVEALGRTESPDAVADLARAMKDPALRRAAIEALGRVGGDAAAAVLADATNPRTADLALVRALGATGSVLAVPALRTLAREPALCVGAAEELGRIADAEAVFALADLLAEPRTAHTAAESLGALPAAIVVPALLDRMDDPAAAARARRALVLVAGADLGRTPDAWRTWWKSRPPSPEEAR